MPKVIKISMETDLRSWHRSIHHAQDFLYNYAVHNLYNISWTIRLIAHHRLIAFTYFSIDSAYSMCLVIFEVCLVAFVVVTVNYHWGSGAMCFPSPNIITFALPWINHDSAPKWFLFVHLIAKNSPGGNSPIVFNKQGHPFSWDIRRRLSIDRRTRGHLYIRLATISGRECFARISFRTVAAAVVVEICKSSRMTMMADGSDLEYWRIEMREELSWEE